MKELEEIDILISKGEELTNKDCSNYKRLNSKIDKWIASVNDSLLNQYPDIAKDFVTEFKIAGESSALTFYLNFEDYKNDPSKIIEDLIEIINKKIAYLKIIKDYIGLSDYLKNNLVPKLTSMERKQNFVLEKLFEVYNDNYYEITKIFDVNKIPYIEQEPEEIADDLKRRGYISLEDYSKNTVKITVKGINYLERQKKKKSKTKRKQEINSRIDSILYELKKLGVGQEIIFDEIEELRGVSDKLTQKSWSQLVKGKVVDLALDSIITKEIATLIYETLADNKFKLLP